jgi:hypothetical protein
MKITVNKCVHDQFRSTVLYVQYVILVQVYSIYDTYSYSEGGARIRYEMRLDYSHVMSWRLRFDTDGMVDDGSGTSQGMAQARWIGGIVATKQYPIATENDCDR